MNARHLLAFAALTASLAVHAQMANMDMPAAPKAAAAAPIKMTQGEALKVDAGSGKVTLRHGPIENLGMPGMTMMFPVADKQMLAGIKDGDPVRFTAQSVHGAIVVTTIELAR